MRAPGHLASIRAVAIEVDDDAGGATVVLRPSDGQDLRASCSCGEPSCAHQRAALASLAALATRPPLDVAGDAPPRSSAPASLSAPRSSRPGAGASGASGAPGDDEACLADLRTLLEALVRAGTGEVTAAVDQALARARAWLAARPRPALARALGRVTTSTEPGRSAAERALAIAALGELLGAAEGLAGDEARAEVLGGPELGRETDLELLELARWRERGLFPFETRLLLDLHRGLLYREEGAPGAPALSDGVAGRVVSAMLASRRLSRPPERLSILQYALEVSAPQEALSRARALASLTLDLPASPLLAASCPPFAWLAPASLDPADDAMTLRDASGASLVVDAAAGGGGGPAETLAALLEGGKPITCLALTFDVAPDGIRALPLAALVESPAGLELVPLAY